MRLAANRQPAVVLLLLLFTAGFAPGPQMGEREASEKANFVPEMEE